MSLNEEEAAQAAELNRTMKELAPLISDGHQRSSDLRKRWGRTGADIAVQATSQAIGTFLAVSVAYILAVVAGALEGTQPLTIVVSVILSLGFIGAVWEPIRLLISPSRRAALKSRQASFDLAGLTVRAKRRDGEALTDLEWDMIQIGLISLQTPAPRPKRAKRRK